MNFIVDLLHEDLNQVTKKPYIEVTDRPDAPDSEVAQEQWDNFKARNQSMIVDTMFGQMKSTVECIDCKNVFTRFDPFQMLQIPISCHVQLHYFARDSEKAALYNITADPKQTFSSLGNQLTQMLKIEKISIVSLDLDTKTVNKEWESHIALKTVRFNDNLFAFEGEKPSENRLASLQLTGS